MRRALLACVVLLAGCVTSPALPSSTLEAEVQAPQAALILPAPVTLPVVADPIRPHDEFAFNQSGLQAINVSASEPWTIHALASSGRHDDPVFMLVYPTRPSELRVCADLPEAFRWHSFITEEGNLLGHPFGPGEYTILLYSERLENLTVRLGVDAPREFRPLQSHAPAVGLQVLQAKVDVDSIAFPYRVRFAQALAPNATTVFLSEFRVRANAHSGTERIFSQVHDGSGGACAKHEASRSGVGGIAAFESRFATVLGPQTYQWSGLFESNASANPRFDATGYALRFVG
jgi:hypothetical protein